MQRPNEQCAAICGLYCGACPAYPNECHGCLSDFVREGCRECKNGFRDCVKAHNINRCYECEQFPCDKLREFSKYPVINGVCNHENVIPDSCRIKEVGIPQWIDEQIIKFTCPQCGERLTWYNIESHSCK